MKIEIKSIGQINYLLEKYHKSMEWGFKQIMECNDTSDFDKCLTQFIKISGYQRYLLEQIEKFKETE